MNKTILLLSDRVEWKNWPTWLKGLFFFWPSLGPAYLFLSETPVLLLGRGEMEGVLANIEYQNYFIGYFLGMWSINLLILGLAWMILPAISETYRFYLKQKVLKKKVVGKKVLLAKRRKRVYPQLIKK